MSAKLYKLITVLTSTSTIHRTTDHTPSHRTSHFQTKKQIPPGGQLFADKYYQFVGVSLSHTKHSASLLMTKQAQVRLELSFTARSIITGANNTMHQVFYCLKLLTRPSSLISWVALWKTFHTFITVASQDDYILKRSSIFQILSTFSTTLYSHYTTVEYTVCNSYLQRTYRILQKN